ncbi:hypothetical protein [Nocardia paucivorans]|uniref:hypothetical protein n=1 Tax=Nocardia paucivorans TaxID=114259 RepID=UPI0002FD8C46|nr:hypothetical protein [Nocardia paucivorans]
MDLSFDVRLLDVDHLAGRGGYPPLGGYALPEPVDTRAARTKRTGLGVRVDIERRAR